VSAKAPPAAATSASAQRPLGEIRAESQAIFTTSPPTPWRPRNPEEQAPDSGAWQALHCDRPVTGQVRKGGRDGNETEVVKRASAPVRMAARPLR